jgi:hypothetical protein
LASLSNSTNRQYQGHLLSFKNFCADRNFPDYLNITMPLGIEYLTKLYHEGKSFSTINSARSALSQFVNIKDNTCTDFGKHPLTTKFMKGVFKLRPQVPRLKTTWDVKPVLQFLRSCINSSAVLKDLSFKCITLLALTTGQRVQTLSKLTLSQAFFHDNKVVFNIDEIIKTSQPGRPHFVELFRFDKEPNLCPVRCLEAYISSTSSLRKSPSLFISFQKPHSAVSSQTLSRWISTVLRSCDIERFFTAHSVRSASASRAFASNIDINCILSTVGWRSETTFAKFYNKPISEEGSFSSSVLSAV